MTDVTRSDVTVGLSNFMRWCVLGSPSKKSSGSDDVCIILLFCSLAVIYKEYRMTSGDREKSPDDNTEDILRLRTCALS
jgi:hypothetical protein